MKRRPLTLIEVIVASGIAALVLLTLFSPFKTSVMLTRKVEVAKHSVIERHLIYQRLLQTFGTVKGDSMSTESVEGSEKRALLFTFENRVDPSLAFSGTTKGKIFVDDGGNLLLRIYSPCGQGLVRDEVLMTHVDELEWDLSSKEVIVMKVGDISYPFFLPKPDNKPLSLKGKT
jgi:hypothetical protein